MQKPPHENEPLSKGTIRATLSEEANQVAPQTAAETPSAITAVHGARSSNDYRNATGHDHPAESEHDHSHQKLAGESAKMAEDPSTREDPMAGRAPVTPSDT